MHPTQLDHQTNLHPLGWSSWSRPGLGLRIHSSSVKVIYYIQNSKSILTSVLVYFRTSTYTLSNTCRPIYPAPRFREVIWWWVIPGVKTQSALYSAWFHLVSQPSTVISQLAIGFHKRVWTGNGYHIMRNALKNCITHWQWARAVFNVTYMLHWRLCSTSQSVQAARVFNHSMRNFKGIGIYICHNNSYSVPAWLWGLPLSCCCGGMKHHWGSLKGIVSMLRELFWLKTELLINWNTILMGSQCVVASTVLHNDDSTPRACNRYLITCICSNLGKGMLGQRVHWICAFLLHYGDTSNGSFLMFEMHLLMLNLCSFVITEDWKQI